MRIAFVVEGFPKLCETFVLRQITGLIDRGHDVDIFARKAVPEPKVHPDVRAYGLEQRVRYGFELPEGEPERREPHDIIHCQVGQLGYAGLGFRGTGFLEGKVVTSFRGQELTRVGQSLRRDFYAMLFDQGDLFLPVCEDLRRRLVDLGCDPGKIVVHRAGIDCLGTAPREHEDLSGRPARLISVARLVRMKGIDVALRAIALLRKAGRSVEYRVFGEGHRRGTLEALIGELGLQDCVTLPGWMDTGEVAAALRQSDLLLAPSLTDEYGVAEGIPNALKEAMVWGVPVVATRHAGIPELVEDGVSGLLVPESDAEALARAIDRLLSSEDLRSRLGRAGRAHVLERYDSEKQNDELVGIYRRLLKGPENF